MSDKLWKECIGAINEFDDAYGLLIIALKELRAVNENGYRTLKSQVVESLQKLVTAFIDDDFSAFEVLDDD